jgi:predicted 2-oxoglutarate/Fe(II)-dependent dioxygenase YbiX
VAGTARERLAELLAAQDEVSSSVQLRAKAPADLHLEVEGIGPITLPVTAAQAQALRRLGRRAPFGRGEETLTDPGVRDTWEIPKELVRAEWAGGQGLSRELDAVRDELGLPRRCRLTAELHSLLLYEKGQFFLPHQDSEKSDAMIATLVVTLPSAHTGGELAVHHLGEATTYRGSKTHLSLVAFYADCLHEVRPVTSGHRITLTYDLILHGGAPAVHVTDDATVAEAARHLREHFSTRVRHRYRDTTSEPPDRLAFLLDHEYTEHALSWARLKGADAHRAWLLRAAADAAGCETVLSLTEIQEIWDAADDDYEDDDYEDDDYEDDDYEDDDYEDDDYEDDDYEDDDTRYQLNELVDSSIRLTRWTDPDATSAEDVNLAVDDDEVCAVTPSRDLQPYSSEYEGYMGNYGNTLDRWYRRAAVLVWPRDRRFTNRAQASPAWALDDLCATARDQGPGPARDAAATLAPYWDSAVRSHQQPGSLLARALPAALAVDDADTAAMLLRPFAVETLAPHHLEPLAELTGRYGEPWTDRLVRTWFAGRSGRLSVLGPSRARWLTTLPALCAAGQTAGDHGAVTARLLLGPAWEGLAALISSSVALPPTSSRDRQLADLGPDLTAVTAAAATMQAAELLDQIVGSCRQHGEALTPTVMSALRALPDTPSDTSSGTWPDDAFAELAADQATLLRARLARPPRAEGDWSITLPAGCGCPRCRTLGSFLADPARRTFEWPLAKADRAHVHSRIDHAELPVTHRTRRQGRPYALVLIKTTQLFQREARQRAQDRTDLDRILRRASR